MKPTIQLDNAVVFHGSCLDVLPTFADNSVDSIVCDPPYELGFMGKSWDASGIAYNVKVWEECLRVLKPGGHLLAFGGSRTWHRLAVAIEDAGFEMRDSIAWLYGSGFPKSHNISKAIDKLHGAEREIVGQVIAGIAPGQNHIVGGDKPLVNITGEPVTDDAKKWDGWGTALKPAFEPVVVARKPLVGTVAENVLQFGTGGINIDASRIGTQGENFDNLQGRPIQKLATRRDGETDDEYKARVLESPAQQEALNKLKNLGRWPANVIFGHAEDCVQIGISEEKYSINKLESWSGFGQVERPDFESSEQVVSNPVFECVDGCPVKLLDEQTEGKTTQGHWAKTKVSGYGEFGGGSSTYEGVGRKATDSGGASRFFYVAKANKKDRNEGLDNIEGQSIGAKGNGLARICEKCGTSILNPCECPDRTYINPVRQNFHPTVKPTQLMRYLVKLVTPPNGTVLDPFTGSGSTGKAALLEGFQFVGIELTEEYLPIIEGRLKFVAEKVEEEKGDDLFADLSLSLSKMRFQTR